MPSASKASILIAPASDGTVHSIHLVFWLRHLSVTVFACLIVVWALIEIWIAHQFFWVFVLHVSLHFVVGVNLLLQVLIFNAHVILSWIQCVALINCPTKCGDQWMFLWVSVMITLTLCVANAMECVIWLLWLKDWRACVLFRCHCDTFSRFCQKWNKCSGKKMATAWTEALWFSKNQFAESKSVDAQPCKFFKQNCQMHAVTNPLSGFKHLGDSQHSLTKGTLETSSKLKCLVQSIISLQNNFQTVSEHNETLDFVHLLHPSNTEDFCE